MKLPAPRRAGLLTGRDAFRLASLCLYVTLLLHAVLAAAVHRLPLSASGIGAVAALALLFQNALLRYRWPASFCAQRVPPEAELGAAAAAVICLTLLQHAPAQALPWLIGLAGVFPLALARTALPAVILLALAGAALNVALGSTAVDWLPQLCATLFAGLGAIFLGRSLDSKLVALRQARLNERRFNAIARATRSVFLIADTGYRIKYANHALEDIVGYTLDEITRDRIRPEFHPDDAAEHRRKLRYLRDTPHSSIFSRHRTRHRHGHWVWMETRGYNMLHDGAINGLVFSIEDISARKDAELKLREEHALLRAVLDLNPSMIYATDLDGRFTMSNRTFQRRFGFGSDEAIRGKTIHDILRPPDSRSTAEILFRQDLQVMHSGTPLEDVELQGLDASTPAWYRVNKYPLHDTAGATVGMLSVARDITDRKEYELQLRHQALHDPLTGLPNRRYLLQTVADAIRQAEASAAELAMLFCDLDFFKSVNDMHGHDFGDKCLTKITQRIQSLLPAQDFVARFGGNEFVILTNATIAEARERAERLLQVVAEPLSVDDTVVKIQASIGVARLEAQYATPSELIRDADAAMYQAKERGRNRVEVFDAALRRSATRHAQMDVALRFALERDELKPVYQPKVALSDGAIQGFELLLRWDSPQYGIIPPVEFIPVAESSGLVVPIGLWVLEQACRQMRAWQAEYSSGAGFTIAVNVSMRQLLQASFLADVAAILERTGVAPQSIELELTESSAMANPVQAVETLAHLKQLGLRLALDDFGTGYSSLAHLQKLPIDVLKIDKAFVRELERNPGETEIVKLILALAQALNLDTVAEGVESRADLLRLKEMGCRQVQGFVLSPPLSAARAGELLRSGRRFSIQPG